MTKICVVETKCVFLCFIMLQLVLREILLQNQAGDMLHVATDAGYADRMIARMGLKYAVIVISTLPILLIFPFVQRFFAKGVMIGAIKG